MEDDSDREPVWRRAVAWSLGWLAAAAFYLLLIDTTQLPELIVGAGAAVLAASGLELAREQRIVGEAVRTRWLARVYRPLAQAPSDLAVLSLLAIRQLVRRDAVCGEFRQAPFRGRCDGPGDAGRRSLAEAFGSFAPNTIVIGVDTERELIVAHQLRRSGGPEAIDMLELG
jgi:hypothetical protein